jgi:predicted nucleic acid-binding Zn ribbon protein
LSTEHAAGKSRRQGGRKQGKPVVVGDALRKLTGSLGITTRLSEYDVLTGWDRIVGEQIARVSTAERIEHGILYVGVRSAAWRNELTMRRQEILERIHRTTGRKVVREIRFR